MVTLAIESSAKAASVALTRDHTLIAQFFESGTLTHSRTLLKMAEDMLSGLNMKLPEVDVIAVATGPGSFTGIRIGVAAAKGLCWGLDKPVCGVSTLEAMAYQLSDRENCVISPVMDARRNQIYNAKFKSVGGKLVRITDDRAISVAQLLCEAANDKTPYFLVGDGAVMCYNAFAGAGLPAALPPEPLLLQTAWGVAKAAERVEPVNANDITPNYLRLSQAERERLEKEKKQGGNGNV